MASLADDLDSLDAELSRLSTTDAKLDAISQWAQVSRAANTPSVFLSSEGTTRGAGHLGSVWPDPEFDQFSELLSKHGISSETYAEHVLQANMDNGRYILDMLPCAHVVPGQGWSCPQNGTLTCGNCKIVRYCSKVRQGPYKAIRATYRCRSWYRTARRSTGRRTSWVRHSMLCKASFIYTATDCKDSIRSDQWVPAWTQERRRPAFVEPDNAPEPSDWRSKSDRLAMGMSL
jgi:hypothetical protein